VQLPHCPWSHPFFAPVRSRCSRSRSSSVVRGSTAITTCSPLTCSSTGTVPNHCGRFAHQGALPTLTRKPPPGSRRRQAPVTRRCSFLRPYPPVGDSQTHVRVIRRERSMPGRPAARCRASQETRASRSSRRSVWYLRVPSTCAVTMPASRSTLRVMTSRSTLRPAVPSRGKRWGRRSGRGAGRPAT